MGSFTDLWNLKVFLTFQKPLPVRTSESIRHMKLKIENNFYFRVEFSFYFLFTCSQNEKKKYVFEALFIFKEWKNMFLKRFYVYKIKNTFLKHFQDYKMKKHVFKTFSYLQNQKQVFQEFFYV